MRAIETLLNLIGSLLLLLCYKYINAHPEKHISLNLCAIAIQFETQRWKNNKKEEKKLNKYECQLHNG